MNGKKPMSIGKLSKGKKKIKQKRQPTKIKSMRKNTMGGKLN